MAKIGKIIPAVLIAGIFFVFPAAAQQGQTDQPQAQLQPQAVQQRQTGGWTRTDLQNIYIEYLRQEGYLPAVDADGDIQFKVSGDNYFIIIDEKDLQFFQIYLGFSLGDVSSEAAVNAANYSNRHSKVAKISISSDGRVANVTAELLLNDPKDFMPVLARALSLIRNAENIFLTQLRQSPAS
jgi:hypothetical protein